MRFCIHTLDPYFKQSYELPQMYDINLYCKVLQFAEFCIHTYLIKLRMQASCVCCIEKCVLKRLGMPSTKLPVSTRNLRTQNR